MEPRQERRMKKSQMMGQDVGAKRGARYLDGVAAIDYKDCELLRKFMTERGKVMPRRLTGTTAKQQREIRRAIGRARVLGLLP